MLKRTWGVRPDESGTVSREALINALIDGATMLDIAGGYLEVAVGRAPTDIPDEMVMTAVLVCWKSRASGINEPERAGAATPPESRTAVGEPTPYAGVQITGAPIAGQQPESSFADDVAREQRAVADEIARNPRPQVEPDEDNPDGFDFDRMPDEDIEDEPVATR